MSPNVLHFKCNLPWIVNVLLPLFLSSFFMVHYLRNVINKLVTFGHFTESIPSLGGLLQSHSSYNLAILIEFPPYFFLFIYFLVLCHLFCFPTFRSAEVLCHHRSCFPKHLSVVQQYFFHTKLSVLTNIVVNCLSINQNSISQVCFCIFSNSTIEI